MTMEDLSKYILPFDEEILFDNKRQHSCHVLLKNESDLFIGDEYYYYHKIINILKIIFERKTITTLILYAYEPSDDLLQLCEVLKTVSTIKRIVINMYRRQI